MRRLRTSPAALLLACALAVLLLAGCGGDDDSKPSVQANETDLAFADEMLAHVQRGIDAAELARTRAEDPVVRRSARDLIQLESPNAQVLRQVVRTLAAAGIEKGDLGVPPTTLQPARLRAAEDFDAAYASAMIAHHQTAIRMSEVERRRGIHAGLRDMTRDFVDLARFQSRQLERQRAGGG
jgi:uncharacterized protein (DUF305 family)